MLEVRDLHAGYDPANEIVHGISFSLDDGEFCCIIGANGCGKTTTLRTVLGLLPRLSGEVLVNGRETARMNERELALHFAYIPQIHQLPFPYRVKDMVLMGRTPHMARLSAASRDDKRVAYAALCQMAIENLADKSYTELSGGQQQLVLIARALAQQPDILVMDEPTASLDFGNQQLVLSRMRGLADCGTSVLMVTHDPAHAFYCADRAVVLHEGVILQDGAPDQVITPETMRTIYNTEVRIDRVDLGGGKTGSACIPIVQEGTVDQHLLAELMRGKANGNMPGNLRVAG